MRDRAEEVDAVGDPGGGRARAKAVEQLPAAGDDQMHALVAEPRQAVDREVETLEVVGAVERRDEAGDDRVGVDAEALRAARRRRPRR